MTAEGERGQRESIEISQYWQEQLSAMPYLSCKYLILTIHHCILINREERQDHPPPQVQVQEDPARTQEEKDPHPGHILRLQGVQEEADADAEGANTTYWADPAISSAIKTCSGQHPAVAGRRHRQRQEPGQDEQQMNEGLIVLCYALS